MNAGTAQTGPFEQANRTQPPSLALQPRHAGMLTNGRPASARSGPFSARRSAQTPAIFRSTKCRMPP
jgi:hypothetical protein